MFAVRQANADDLDDLFELAQLLDTVNFPADRPHLEGIVARSDASFGASGEDPEAGRYLFALEDLDAKRVVGVSMIIAAHGSVDDPHHYFQVDVDERYSATLGALFRHETLQFRRSLTPHTELGALVLHPDYRGRPERLGRLLSFARFAYIAAHRSRFKDAIQAELLPPFEPDGTSLLWEWLGRRFTGLDYPEADRLSSSNHEFTRELFPRTPLYTSLMPPEVRAVIGDVGPATRGVARMLESVGFRYNRHIDPFDGGPHYECRTDDVSLVRDAIHTHADIGEPGPDAPVALLATRNAHGSAGFVATTAPCVPGGDHALIDDATAATLSLRPRDPVVVTPLPHRP